MAQTQSTVSLYQRLRHRIVASSPTRTLWRRETVSTNKALSDPVRFGARIVLLGGLSVLVSPEVFAEHSVRVGR